MRYAVQPSIMELIFAGDGYFAARSGLAEFVTFRARLRALGWTMYRHQESVHEDMAELRRIAGTGEHLVAGQERQCDLMLFDTMVLLDLGVRAIGAGVVVVSGVAALESLASTLLERATGEVRVLPGPAAQARRAARALHRYVRRRPRRARGVAGRAPQLVRPPAAGRDEPYGGHE